MAIVKVSNADVFSMEFGPVFAYKKSEGLIYSFWNKHSKTWDIFRNGNQIAILKVKDHYERTLLSHPAMLSEIKSEWLGDDDLNGYIRGRIDHTHRPPIIYVHDLCERNHTAYVTKNFEHLVDKAIDAVYKYMEKVL